MQRIKIRTEFSTGTAASLLVVGLLIVGFGNGVPAVAVASDVVLLCSSDIEPWGRITCSSVGFVVSGWIVESITCRLQQKCRY